MSKLQYQLYAENKRAILIVFQAVDAAEKANAKRRNIKRGKKRQAANLFTPNICKTKPGIPTK